MKWIRPTITMMFAAGMTAGFFLGMITAEAYLPIATAAIIWWFKSRDQAKEKPE